MHDVWSMMGLMVCLMMTYLMTILTFHVFEAIWDLFDAITLTQLLPLTSVLLLSFALRLIVLYIKPYE